MDQKTNRFCSIGIFAIILLFIANPSHAQFSGSFDPSNWSTVHVNGGNGTINTSGAPATIALTSPNGTNAGAFTYYEITPPCAGTITFDWSVAHTDPGFDVFGYSINGANSFLANTTTAGSVSISVAYGQTFAFYGDGADGCCGSLTSTISNFTFTQAAVLNLTTAAITGPCAGQDSLYLNYILCGATFTGGNSITIQLSDTLGSFASPTILGVISTTSASDTLIIALPSNLYSSSGYLTRLVSTSPVYTSNTLAIGEIETEPPIPNWVFPFVTGTCSDSVIFIDTIGTASYNSVDIPISLTNIATENAACGDNGPYSCTGNITASWSDSGNGSISSGVFYLNATLNCTPGLVLNFYLNGNFQGTDTVNINDCSCSEFGGGSQILSVPINPADYNVGGANTMAVTTGNCVGVNVSGTLGGGAAMVSIIGYEYIAQYSFDTLFSTIVASGDTAIFDPGANSNVYVRYLSIGSGCTSDFATKPIVMDTGVYVISTNTTGICATTDTIEITYGTCNTSLIGGNVLTFQLSDTFGSFSSPITLGTASTTVSSGTLFFTIPSNVYSNSNYQVRVVSSNPSSVSVGFPISPVSAMPPTPTWVYSDTVDLCLGDSVTFQDTSSTGGFINQTLILGLSNVATSNAACGSNGPYSCGAPITVTWTDSLSGSVSDVQFSIFASLNCNASDQLNFTLNGGATQSASINFSDCSCTETGPNQITTISADPNDYIVGGVNTMVITFNDGGNCVGINTSGSLGGGAVQIDLTGTEYFVAQYSFDSTFTTIEAQGNLATFSTQGMNSVYARYIDPVSGCVSFATEKPINYGPCSQPGSGYAAVFDGVDDKIYFAGQPSTVVDNFTIEGWIKPSSFGGGNHVLFYNGSTSSTGWGLYTDPSGNLRVLYGGVMSNATSYTVPVDEWSHVALVRNSGTLTVYANGLNVLSGISTGPNVPASGLQIGANDIGSEFFNGQIDEVRIWEMPMTQSQIRDNMCRKMGPGSSGFATLKAYYRFDENQGNIAYDRSASNAHSSLLNGVTWTLSGAAIGDTSHQQYSVSPALSITDNLGNTIQSSNFTGSPAGAHLYLVNEGPISSSIPSGYLALEDSRYFGVFAVGGTNSTFNLEYDYNNNAAINGSANEARAGLLKRASSSDTTWKYTRFFTDSLVNNIVNCRDTNDREFIVGFSNSTIFQGAAIGQNAMVYLNNAGIGTITATSINNGSFDTCGIDSIWIDVTTFSCADTAGTAVVLFVQNGQGYIYTDTVIVTAIDTFAPIVNTQNFTAYLDAFGAYSLASAEIDNGSTDSCGIVSLTLDSTALSCVNIGSPLTVTLTATDGNGNTASASATVTVLDTLAPTIITQNINAYLNGSGMVTINALQIDNGTTDGCGIGSRSLSDSLFTCSDIGAAIGVTFYATDIYGNTDSAVALVTVLDTMSPAAAAQSLTLYLDSSGQAFTSSLSFDNGSGDNCTVASIVASDTVFTCADTTGAIQIILTVIDGSGNSDTAHTSVTVVDTIAPSVITQNVSVYLDSTGNYSMTASEVDGGSTDNCNIASLSISLASFTCADVGTPVTVTLSATDVSGNTNSNTAVVTVLDTISPQIITQNISVYLDSSGFASINASMIDAGTTDACGIDSIYLNNYNYSCANVGANSVTFFALDVNGNMASSIATVSVFDTIAPEVITQNITVYLNSAGLFTLMPAMIDSGTWDSCGVTSYALDITNLNCGNIGTPVTVTLSATDVNGNISTNSATVNVLDTIAPQIITQALTIYLDSTGNTAITASMVDNGTWDSCGVDSIYLDVYTFDCDNLGANTVWFFALDINGNLDSATSTITIVDTTTPQVLTQNITVALDSSGLYTLTPAEIDAGSVDACGIASIALDITAFGCSDVGTPSTVTLTVTDSNGNSATNTATVTVIDTVSPAALAVQSLTVYLDSLGQYTLNYSEIDSASFDNCSIESYVLDTFNFNCSNLGSSVTVTLTVTDSSGFTDSTTTLVTILDTIAPSVVAQNISVYLDSFGSATITAAQLDSATSDACGVDSIYLNNYTFNCNDLGANNITLFAVDSSGNVGSSVAILTVMDTIAPEVITQPFSAYLDLNGTFTLLPTHIDNQSWDSCGIASYVLDTSQLSCQNIGDTLVVTLTVTDVNGNSNSASAQVFIFDTLAPTVLAQAVTVYLDSFGAASISASMVNSGTWDSCGISSIWLSDSVFNCGDTTSQTIMLYAADVHGNLDSNSAVVNILDTQPPVVITTNLMLYLSDSGLISITASSVNNGSADNCAIDSMWLDTYVFSCADTGTNNIITLYVQDESGNMDSNTSIVQVFDTTSPTVITQNITVYLDSLGAASISATQLDGGSTDNCSINSISISQSTFNCSNSGGDIQVALSIIDFSGNFSVDTATVSVFDTVAPTVYTQPLTVALDSFGNAQITTAMVDSGSWDACGIDSLSLSQSTFDCADVGVNTVVLSVTDNNGNVNTASAVVTIIDTIAPQIIAQNLTVYLDITGTAVIDADSIDIGTWDSCGIASLSIDSANFSCLSHDDTIAILFTAEDIHGNISTSTVFVHVLDTMPPVVLAIGDTVFLDSAGTFTVAFQSLDLGTFDNCTMGAIDLSDSTFDCSAVDSAVAIWFIASDSFGNMDSLEVFISVLDSIHPIISCPDSIVVPNDAGVCGAVITFSFPTASDNCSVDTVIQIDSSTLVSGSFFPVGFTELFYVAYDQSGNTDTCSFIIEVQDVEAPFIICINDTSICDTTFTYNIPEYTDNCSGFDVVQIAGLPSGVFYPVGVTVNTFEVTDSYGNSDTCSFSVLRYDFPSAANAGPDQRQCEDFDAQLAANTPSVGFGFWRVLNGAGNIVDSTDPSSLINSLIYGIDTLEWRIENGVCPIERDTMRLIIDQSIAIANAGADQTLCDTAETKLAALAPNIGIGHWEFSYDSVFMDDSLSPEALVSGIKQGVYTFTWSVENGVCPVTDDEVIVRVVPYPLLTVSNDVFIFPPTEVTLEATSDIGISFAWLPTENIQNENEATAIVSPPQTTIYWVTATTADGCSVTDSVTIFVNTDLEIPTAFTPDGDNVNDFWNIKELQSYPSCKVSIFNRWGNLMFVSEGYSSPWDGTFNGEPLPSGAYFFVINLNVGEVSPLTGSITIIK